MSSDRKTGARARPVLRAFAALAAIGVFALLVGLGIWQVQRLAWKNDVIAQVDARITAHATAAPGPAYWADMDDEYRRVMVTGWYLPVEDTLVQAVTDRGAGFWVMTPFLTDGGWQVLINRGFIASDQRNPALWRAPEGLQTVEGLLRMSQPGGAFLRENDPEGGRWYSRDTAAIAQSLGIGAVAPWFLDAAGNDAPPLPVQGLTVVEFRNSHLGYALTWFALAILWAGTLIYFVRRRSSERPSV